MPGVGATDELVIELSKGKAILIIVGCVVFFAGGYWMFTADAATVREGPINDPLFVHGVGLAGMVFGGLGVIFGIRKLFDKKSGLVFNSSGIIDNSSGLAAGFIPWSEIIGAEIYEVHRQKMLIIKVRHPEKFTQRGNLLRRALVKIGSKMSGSPIAIAPNTLKINFSELLSTFERYHQKYGQSMKASV
jgi:hypothetical protein